MRTNVTRRLTLAAAAGALVVTAAVPGAPDAAASSDSAAAGVVPAPGSGTAYGYNALIRHPKGPDDNQGKLVLLAPDGRSKTVGQVSDGAYVVDVSSNARTVVTGFLVNTGQELRLTIWDTASGKPTYLRVKDGVGAVLVKDGIVVSRGSAGAQLYSRSGKLQRTYAKTGDPTVMASADGTRLAQGARAKGVVVRDVRSGKETHRVAVPSGRNACSPDHQLGSSSFSMACDDPGQGAPGESTAYRAGYTAAVPTAQLVEGSKRSGDLRGLAGGRYVYDAAAATPGSEPALQDKNGSTSYLKDFPGVGADTVVSGGYQNTVFLSASEGWADKPAFTLQRVDVQARTTKTVAGPGSALGGKVTSAQTVDGT